MRTSSIRGSSTVARYSTSDERTTGRSAASNSSRVARSSDPLGRTSRSTALNGNSGRHAASARQPRLVPAGEVGGPAQTELLERDRRQGRGVPLVADEDDAPPVAGPPDAVGAGGIETPLEHVAVDPAGARQLSVPPALLDGADVDHQRSCLLLGIQVGGIDTFQPLPSGCDQVVDGA